MQVPFHFIMRCTTSKFPSVTSPAPTGQDALSAQALARQQLRAAAVRVTAARVKVLGALLAAQRALSHQDIQQHFASMDRVTLYRALDTLTAAGLAHKIAGDDRTFRYSAGTELATSDQDPEAAAGPHSHGHFKCARCAKIFCLDDSTHAAILTGEVLASAAQPALRQQLQQLLQQSLGPGFLSQDVELTIKGLCPDCNA